MIICIVAKSSLFPAFCLSSGLRQCLFRADQFFLCSSDASIRLTRRPSRPCATSRFTTGAAFNFSSSFGFFRLSQSAFISRAPPAGNEAKLRACALAACSLARSLVVSSLRSSAHGRVSLCEWKKDRPEDAKDVVSRTPGGPKQNEGEEFFYFKPPRREAPYTVAAAVSYAIYSKDLIPYSIALLVMVSVLAAVAAVAAVAATAV